MRVVVIGAGIGGLALAQGLRSAGVDVSVHDRDAAAGATGGYRLHLDPPACAALRRHLAPAHYQALLASSADPASSSGFTAADHRLRVLTSEVTDDGEDRLMVGRVPLRRLLAHGLEDVLHWDSEYTAHSTADEGSVTVRFADGSTDHGDLLVAADGAHSRVAAAQAGRVLSEPTGFSSITARVPLTAANRPLVPRLLDHGAALSFGPDGTALFLTRHEPDRPAVDPATCTEVPAEAEPATVVWGLIAPDDRYPDDVRERTDLPAVAATMLAPWPASLRELVATTDPALPGFYGFPAATARSVDEVFPWAAGRVTAIGDAVHAMPPTGGRAAATAIRDADLLVHEITAATVPTLPLAVHRYQRGAAAWGLEAVRASLVPLRVARRTRGPLARQVVRVALPAVSALTSLRGTGGR